MSQPTSHLSPERLAEIRAIVAARTEVPKLRAEVESLQEHLDKVTAVFTLRVAMLRDELNELRGKNQLLAEWRAADQAEMERLRNELATARAEVLREAADAIVASCFAHNEQTEQGWIDCHCVVADELRRMAAEGGAQ